MPARSPIECLRICCNLTQAQVAKRLTVSPSTFARIETGQVKPSPANRAALCGLFGVHDAVLDEPRTNRARAALHAAMVRAFDRSNKPAAPVKPAVLSAGKQPFPKNFRLK